MIQMIIVHQPGKTRKIKKKSSEEVDPCLNYPKQELFPKVKNQPNLPGCSLPSQTPNRGSMTSNCGKEAIKAWPGVKSELSRNKIQP